MDKKSGVFFWKCSIDLAVPYGNKRSDLSVAGTGQEDHKIWKDIDMDHGWHCWMGGQNIEIQQA